MSNLQNAIINQYRDIFPNDTLKEISRKTKIQITRVFRIINGSEMKLSEYEAFELSIDNKVNRNKFNNKAKECNLILSQNRLNQIYAQMCQAVKISKFSNTKQIQNHFINQSSNLQLV